MSQPSNMNRMIRLAEKVRDKKATKEEVAEFETIKKENGVKNKDIEAILAALKPAKT